MNNTPPEPGSVLIYLGGGLLGLALLYLLLSPAAAPPTAAPAARGRLIVMPGSFYLREQPEVSSVGAVAYPAGTQVRVLAAIDDVERGAAEKLYEVEVVISGATVAHGYTFVPSTVLP